MKRKSSTVVEPYEDSNGCGKCYTERDKSVSNRNSHISNRKLKVSESTTPIVTESDRFPLRISVETFTTKNSQSLGSLNELFEENINFSFRNDSRETVTSIFPPKKLVNAAAPLIKPSDSVLNPHEIIIRSCKTASQTSNQSKFLSQEAPSSDVLLAMKNPTESETKILQDSLYRIEQFDGDVDDANISSDKENDNYYEPLTVNEESEILPSSSPLAPASPSVSELAPAPEPASEPGPVPLSMTPEVSIKESFLESNNKTTDLLCSQIDDEQKSSEDKSQLEMQEDEFTEVQMPNYREFAHILTIKGALEHRIRERFNLYELVHVRRAVVAGDNRLLAKINVGRGRYINVLVQILGNNDEPGAEIIDTKYYVSVLNPLTVLH